MSTNNLQIKNSFIYLLPVIINNLLPFITLPIFTRLLTKEDYGIFALAQVYGILVNGLVHLGMVNVYNRNFFQYREDKRKTAALLYSILAFVFINFILFVTLTYLFRGFFAELIIGSKEHDNILFFVFCANFFVSFGSYYLTYYKNSEDAATFVFYTILGGIITFLSSIFFIVIFRIGIIGFAYSQIISGIVVFTLLTKKVYKLLPVSFNKNILMDSLRIGYPLTPRIIVGVIGSQFDKYMIGLMATTGGVGIYSIGQRIANVVFIYMTSIQNVFSPRVFDKMFNRGGDGGKEIGQYLTPFIYISILVAIGIALFSEEVVIILTPASYHGAIDIVSILSMYYGVLFFGKQPQLLYAKKTYIVSILSISNIIVNVMLNIPFIMKWGAVGAAWATFTAGIINGAISFVVSQYYYKIEWEYKIIGFIYGLFLSSVTLIILCRHFEISYLNCLIIKLIFISTYFYIGNVINLVTFEKILLLKEVFLEFFQKEQNDHSGVKNL